MTQKLCSQAGTTASGSLVLSELRQFRPSMIFSAERSAIMGLNRICPDSEATADRKEGGWLADRSPERWRRIGLWLDPPTGHKVSK